MNAQRKTKPKLKLPVKSSIPSGAPIPAKEKILKHWIAFKRDSYSRKYYFLEGEETATRTRLRYSTPYTHEIDAKIAQDNNKISWSNWYYPQ